MVRWLAGRASVVQLIILFSNPIGRASCVSGIQWIKLWVGSSCWRIEPAIATNAATAAGSRTGMPSADVTHSRRGKGTLGKVQVCGRALNAGRHGQRPFPGPTVPCGGARAAAGISAAASATNSTATNTSGAALGAHEDHTATSAFRLTATHVSLSARRPTLFIKNLGAAGAEEAKIE